MSEKLLEVKDLKVYFEMKKGFAQSLFGKPEVLKAVDGVSFSLDKGEILSLVGESGSGKTTTAKAILQLVPVTGGSVVFNGEEIVGKKDLSEFRKKAQMIYQDPYQSLNPRQYISDIVGEPLMVNELVSTIEERDERIREALEEAALVPPEDYWFRRPFELSGGQRQRAAIAGSLIMKPDLVAADEPVSMLDASIRTGIIDFMLKERDLKGVAYLFITHDLSVIAEMADRVMVMYAGKVVELADVNTIFENPLHPYTRGLIGSRPDMSTSSTRLNVIPGNVPDLSDLPEGCSFGPRCSLVCDQCRAGRPELVEVAPGHFVRCFVTGGKK